MVSETHPHDIELFEYVEGDLTAARRDEIAAHLAACDVCAEQVELATAGRQTLRDVGLTELPEGRRDEILRNLPRQEPEQALRERVGFPKGLLVGLAVLLVVAAFTAVLVKGGGNSMESSAGATGGGAAEATATGGGGLDAAHAADLSASGSPEAVAEELQRRGFKASVQQDRVVVHGATKAQVREALADRGPGDVEVVVKNP
ncbi:MAG TPA: zf-HC2 domain-containing protein [Gaiellaceae bacterium]|jgi:anti-sigma factor RsiW|nr:zf-HC2 domain-containing protein [Gaiellaceae bacterium]